MPCTTSERPASYATRDEARAYMVRVLARPVPAGRPRVYLIYSPKLREANAFVSVYPAIKATLRSAELLEHRDVFGRGALTVEARVPLIAAASDAALVIPYGYRLPEAEARYLMGYSAAAEARALVGLGLPVLVFTPGGLAAWPDVRVRAAPNPHPRHLPLELDMPELSAKPLPTVVASMRALGLPVPRSGRP